MNRKTKGRTDGGTFLKNRVFASKKGKSGNFWKLRGENADDVLRVEIWCYAAAVTGEQHEGKDVILLPRLQGLRPPSIHAIPQVYWVRNSTSSRFGESGGYSRVTT